VSAFIVYAALLTLVAVAAVVWPLARQQEGPPVNWGAAGLGALAVVAGAALLYPVWSQWNWSEPQVTADSPAAMVGRLARRLEREPNDLEGWLMLGRSYAQIEQYPLSARAYERADSLAGGQNAEAITGLAEALVLSDRGGLDGRAGRLFEKALELDPNSTKSLFYSAIAALERKEFPLARQRFERLLAGNPPPEVRRIIEEQVVALAAIGAGSASAPPVAGGEAAASPAAPATAGATIALRISMAAAVADRAAAGAPLFILARVPGQRGPPLAARRLEARFPQTVELRDSDAVMGGAGFTPGQELEIEARVANGGSAMARTGDPFGTVRVRVGDKTPVALEINQLKP
jgi:cytochrome c-type biogenesis protein CcmH